MAKPQKQAAKKHSGPKPFSKARTCLVVAFVVFLLLASSTLTFYLFFLDRIYPGIFIGNINLSGLSRDQAKLKLSQIIDQRSQMILPLHQPGEVTTLYLPLSGYRQAFNLDAAVEAAFTYGHTRFYRVPVHLALSAFYQPLNNPPLQSLERLINQPAIDARIQTDSENRITVTSSQNGTSVDQAALSRAVADYFSGVPGSSAVLTLNTTLPALSYSAALAIKNYLEQVRQQPLNLTFQPSDKSPPIQPTRSLNLDLPTLLTLIDSSHSSSTLATLEINHHSLAIESAQVGHYESYDYHLSFKPEILRAYLENLASSINRPVKEPIFVLDPAGNRGQGRVTDFQPPQEGRQLDIEGSVLALTQQVLAENNHQIILPLTIIPVHNQLVNQLGIRELLGEGVSHFTGSSLERVFNLSLAAARINGALIAPGGTFSFDKTVGEISAATGYKEGYIIQNGRTVLDDGGGVCQDPTTLFRAVLYAGLPVTERTAHAYRVEYYEEGFPPGLDATIYSPTVDFKFKNDTPGYILIETRVDTTTDTLYYDLYGTSDGRTSKLTTPVVTSQTPAPPALYQDDPTLPKSEVKQTDYAASGANVVFSRTVTRNGRTLIQETYYSNYKPWQAVYLVGTKS